MRQTIDKNVEYDDETGMFYVGNIEFVSETEAREYIEDFGL